jgi:hypothetical protein
MPVTVNAAPPTMINVATTANPQVVRHDGLRHADDIIQSLRALVTDGPCTLSDIPASVLRRLFGDAFFDALPGQAAGDAAAEADNASLAPRGDCRQDAVKRKLQIVLAPVHVIMLDVRRDQLRLRPGVEQLAARIQQLAWTFNPVASGSVALSYLMSLLTPQERRMANECGGLHRVLMCFPEALPLATNLQSLNVGSMRRVAAAVAAAEAAEQQQQQAVAAAPGLFGAVQPTADADAEQRRRVRSQLATLEAARAQIEARDAEIQQQQLQALLSTRGDTAIGQALFAAEGILNDDDAATETVIVLADGETKVIRTSGNDTVDASSQAALAVGIGINKPKRQVLKVQLQHLQKEESPAAAPADPTSSSADASFALATNDAASGDPAGAEAPMIPAATPQRRPWFANARLQPLSVTRPPNELVLESLGYEWVDSRPVLARGGPSASLATMPPDVERRTMPAMTFLRRRPPTALVHARKIPFTITPQALRELHWQGCRDASSAAKAPLSSSAASGSPVPTDDVGPNELRRIVEATCDVNSLDGYDTGFTPDERFARQLCLAGHMPSDWTAVADFVHGSALQAMSRQAASALRASLAQVAFEAGRTVELRFVHRYMATTTSSMEGNEKSRSDSAVLEIRSLVPPTPPAEVVQLLATVLVAASEVLDATVGDGPVARPVLQSILDHRAGPVDRGSEAARGLRLSIRHFGGLNAVLASQPDVFAAVEGDSGAGSAIELHPVGRLSVLTASAQGDVEDSAPEVDGDDLATAVWQRVLRTAPGLCSVTANRWAWHGPGKVASSALDGSRSAGLPHGAVVMHRDATYDTAVVDAHSPLFAESFF